RCVTNVFKILNKRGRERVTFGDLKIILFPRNELADTSQQPGGLSNGTIDSLRVVGHYRNGITGVFAGFQLLGFGNGDQTKPVSRTDNRIAFRAEYANYLKAVGPDGN